VSEIVTVWILVNVPPLGLIVGEGTCTVNDAVATVLFVQPGAAAIAWIVSSDATEIADEYTGEVVVGVEPSAVKYITAPDCVSDSVTIPGPVNASPSGLIVGATV
jgi:hypothetical protein